MNTTPGWDSSVERQIRDMAELVEAFMDDIMPALVNEEDADTVIHAALHVGAINGLLEAAVDREDVDLVRRASEELPCLLVIGTLTTISSLGKDDEPQTATPKVSESEAPTDTAPLDLVKALMGLLDEDETK